MMMASQIQKRLRGTLTATLLVAALVAAAPSAMAARATTSTSNPGSVFYVPINRSELITTKSDMAEVVITDPDVANVLVHGKRKVSVIGLQVGQTTLRIFDANHKLIRSTDVYVTYDLPAVLAGGVPQAPSSSRALVTTRERAKIIACIVAPNCRS
jgi:Flp pilus assembly secretin CpaC